MPFQHRHNVRSYRPAVEVLEARNLLSTYVVDHLADDLAGNGPSGSLRYCMTQGVDGDNITFAGGVTGVINLAEALPDLAHSVSIQGPGAALMTVRRDSEAAYRIFTISGSPTIGISGLTLSNGRAPLDSYGNARGGAIFVASGTLTLTECVVFGNFAVGDGVGSGIGGALCVTGGSVVVEGTTLSGNRATSRSNGGGFGGAIAIEAGGSVAVERSTLWGNQAIGGSANRSMPGGPAAGGGIYVALDGTASVDDSTLSGNQATGGHGGDGFPLMGHGTNGGSGGSGEGGGLFAGGGGGMGQSRVTVTNSTIAGNTVRGGNGGNGGNGSSGGNGGNGGLGAGAGLDLGAANLELRNVTVADNTAEDSLGGAAGSGMPPGNPGQDQAGQGGGVMHLAGATVHALNSLFADNSAAVHPDFSGNFASASYTLLSDGTGSNLVNGVNGNLVGSAAQPLDPLLGALADNGGPTRTMALLAGSPALNSGDPNQLGAPDQRGVVRRGGVNFGAYQASASAVVLTAQATVTAGTPVDLTVKAVDPFSQTALGYRGIAHFSSSDGQAVLPSDYSFTSGDAGVHTFTSGVTLKTAGDQTVTTTDTAIASITGSATVAVTPAAADHFMISVPASVSSGTAFDVTVTVVDAYGNTVPTYQGTVHFSSSDTDPGVVLPADYTFQASDSGSHVFTAGVTLLTPGDEMLTVTDPVSGLSGSATVHL